MSSPRKSSYCMDCNTPISKFTRRCSDCSKQRAENRKKKASGWVSGSKQKNKQKAVDYKGGQCIICGYCKCLKSLVFHHLDPSTKDFGISSVSKSFENMKAELDKCILLCSNCHNEVHDGMHPTLTNYPGLESNQRSRT